MDFLEKDLEDIIFETPNKILVEKGLEISGKKFRQVNLGSYGILDIMSIHYCHEYKAVFVDIYELKRGLIDINAFMQVIGYARGIQRYISKTRFIDYDIRLRVNLIGRQLDSSSNFPFIPNIFMESSPYSCEVRYYTYKYGVSGIDFVEETDYFLTEEKFTVRSNHLRKKLTVN